MCHLASVSASGGRRAYIGSGTRILALYFGFEVRRVRGYF